MIPNFATIEELHQKALDAIIAMQLQKNAHEPVPGRFEFSKGFLSFLQTAVLLVPASPSVEALCNKLANQVMPVEEKNALVNCLDSFIKTLAEMQKDIPEEQRVTVEPACLVKAINVSGKAIETASTKQATAVSTEEKKAYDAIATTIITNYISYGHTVHEANLLATQFLTKVSFVSGVLEEAQKSRSVLDVSPVSAEIVLRKLKLSVEDTFSYLNAYKTYLGLLQQHRAQPQQSQLQPQTLEQNLAFPSSGLSPMDDLLTQDMIFRTYHHINACFDKNYPENAIQRKQQFWEKWETISYILFKEKLIKTHALQLLKDRLTQAGFTNEAIAEHVTVLKAYFFTAHELGMSQESIITLLFEPMQQSVENNIVPVTKQKKKKIIN